MAYSTAILSSANQLLDDAMASWYEPRLAQLLKDIAEFVGRRLGTSVNYGPARAGDIEAFLLDSTKIGKLGFAPKVSFWDGLERYIGWRVKQEGEVIAFAVGGD